MVRLWPQPLFMPHTLTPGTPPVFQGPRDTSPGHSGPEQSSSMDTDAGWCVQSIPFRPTVLPALPKASSAGRFHPHGRPRRSVRTGCERGSVPRDGSLSTLEPGGQEAPPPLPEPFLSTASSPPAAAVPLGCCGEEQRGPLSAPPPPAYPQLPLREGASQSGLADWPEVRT